MPPHAVAAGMRALREIEALDVDDDDCPLQRVEILECGQLTEAQVAELVASQDAKRKEKQGKHLAGSRGVGAEVMCSESRMPSPRKVPDALFSPKPLTHFTHTTMAILRSF